MCGNLGAEWGSMKKFALTTAAVLLGLAPLAQADDTPDSTSPAPTAAGCCTKDRSCKSPCTQSDKGIQCGEQAWLDIETVTLEAANGDPIAQYTVAYLTETGTDKAASDTEKAREWYEKSVPGLEKAAAEGHPAACLALAHMYGDGKGVAKNPEKARMYMEMYKKLWKEKCCKEEAKCPTEKTCCPDPEQQTSN